MQAKMVDSPTMADKALNELAQMLASPQLPVQQRIAEDLGVDQPFISNARNGKLKRVTPRVLKLRDYVIMRIDAATAATNAAAEIDAETHAAPTKLRAAGKVIKERRYQEDALAGIKAYLQDGYDPRLIVEQLAVLRRAQRVRRPGRSPPLGVDQAC